MCLFQCERVRFAEDAKPITVYKYLIKTNDGRYISPYYGYDFQWEEGKTYKVGGAGPDEVGHSLYKELSEGDYRDLITGPAYHSYKCRYDAGKMGYWTYENDPVPIREGHHSIVVGEFEIPVDSEYVYLGTDNATYIEAYASSALKFNRIIEEIDEDFNPEKFNDRRFVF